MAESTQNNSASFTPGAIITCRGREWIVMNGSTDDDLILRPASGSEKEIAHVYVPLEKVKPRSAKFDMPDIAQRGNHESSVLLRDALMLSLRRGAGPFRSFGQIAVEPRTYQLVPLMMAMKQQVIRLLIADGVGIGKTIEAGLILREMIDRGEVESFSVICPPSVANQWAEELKSKFNLNALVITSASAPRLERKLRSGQSIFEAYPYTVVSLDYIKTDAHSQTFIRTCPKFIIVDEAHACASQGRRTILSYKLLEQLASDAERHMLLLTATPHSGNENAFNNLLALLHPDFADPAKQNKARLSQYLVQRIRQDLDKYSDGSSSAFPNTNKSIKRDVVYEMGEKTKELYDAVLHYCRGQIECAGDDENRRHKSFFGTLAMMRCIASSPAAALKTLKTRAGLDDESINEARILDLNEDLTEMDDIEPSLIDDPKLAPLIEMAEDLIRYADDKTHAIYSDNKLKALQKRLDELLKTDFRPIIFCRYIATAEYLFDKLKDIYNSKKYILDCVTGYMTPDERKERILALEEAYDDGKLPILIATDCLSEGINLQNAFSAVIHYDLCWNPTRHDQREGRVDRFGQKAKEVHFSMVYGKSNSVDQAVLRVIYKKAEIIKNRLGITVSVPNEANSIMKALMAGIFGEAAFNNSDYARARQQTLFEYDLDEYYKNEEERISKTRSIFSQSSLKPDEVIKEWQNATQMMGNRQDVQRFVNRVFNYIGATPQQILQSQTTFQLPLASLPHDLRERIDAEGIRSNNDNIWVDYDFPGHPKCLSLHRSHPLVSVLAESVLEQTLLANKHQNNNAGFAPLSFGRVAIWNAANIQFVTMIALLRIRYQLKVLGKSFLVEEACTYGWDKKGRILPPDESLTLLKQLPSKPDTENSTNPRKKQIQDMQLQSAMEALVAKQKDIEAFAEERAGILKADHARIRRASNPKNVEQRVIYDVTPYRPVDVIGLFVLMPEL